MQSQTKQFKKKIEKARSILLLTHKGPDLDAFCSMLTAYGFLRQHFPRKKLSMVARQSPSMNIPFMKEITMVKKFEDITADLLIVTDASDLSLCLDKDMDKLDISNIVYIDHHKTEFPEGASMTINELRSSATEQVYATFKDMFDKRLKITPEIAQLVQYGIVSDTGRFLYDLTTSDTFRIFADMKDISSVDLEDFGYRNSKFPREATPAVIEYLKSLTIVGDMAYMYIEKDESMKKGVNEAQSFLRDRYLRAIQGVHWGFIIKPDFDKENAWFVSFRSTKGYQDVSVIAESLGGGGHVNASAVPMVGKSAKEILERVLGAIATLQH